MQTSLVIDSPVQKNGQSAYAISLSQILGRAVDENRGRPTELESFAFVKEPKQRAAVTSGRIDESIAYMTRNLNRPLQVSALAALINISPSHYFALFKRHTGRAPMDYFTRLRMEEARRLLDSTESSVKEVAAALGYDDPFYFSRVFKAVNQLAPSNYRLKRKAQSDSRENSPCKS